MAVAIEHSNLLQLLDRAMADPEFLARLASDPLGTAVTAGVRISADDLKNLLSLAGATDEELVEVLHVRARRTTSADVTGCGCGGGSCQ